MLEDHKYVNEHPQSECSEPSGVNQGRFSRSACCCVVSLAETVRIKPKFSPELVSQTNFSTSLNFFFFAGSVIIWCVVWGRVTTPNTFPRSDGLLSSLSSSRFWFPTWLLSKPPLINIVNSLQYCQISILHVVAETAALRLLWCKTELLTFIEIVNGQNLPGVLS